MQLISAKRTVGVELSLSASGENNYKKSFRELITGFRSQQNLIGHPARNISCKKSQ